MESEQKSADRPRPERQKSHDAIHREGQEGVAVSVFGAPHGTQQGGQREASEYFLLRDEERREREGWEGVTLTLSGR
jgi:hypothetical protein